MIWKPLAGFFAQSIASPETCHISARPEPPDTPRALRFFKDPTSPAVSVNRPRARSGAERWATAATSISAMSARVTAPTGSAPV